MKKSQYYLFLFLMLILSSGYNLLAQNSDSIMLINRKYKYEVGIDVKEFIGRGFYLNSSEYGSTLILKIKRKEKLVNLKGSKNLRFQLGLSGNFPISDKTKQTDSLKGFYEDKGPSSFGFSPKIGFERIKFYGKFNFYYGVDFGPYYSYSDNMYYAHYIYMNNSANTYWSASNSNETKNYGVSVNPFIGIKYRISSRFSASMESGFGLNYFLNKVTYKMVVIDQSTSIVNGLTVLPISKKTSHGFNFSMQYLRFLTINYHL